MNIPFDNSYAQLPGRFFSRQAPEPVSTPGPIRVNRSLAAELGINTSWLESPAGIETLAGNHIPEGADPIATVYAGHQFGGWNPQLGDGRAVLLGEVIGGNGLRYDIQLKGSGRTPYSRSGDGRAPLGPVLREYILSEAMAALDIPTTRALAAVTTGELVYREESLPGAVLTRVAQSHIRIGTFQFFASRRDTEALDLLTRHVIDRHYPQAAAADNPCLAMLQNVVAAQAKLVARWQLLGFIHGVMNTDNMLVSGETIDYGPCAFMDGFNPDQVYSSIDHNGRYAYRNQPGIAQWNLSCLAECLIPLLHEDSEQAVQMAQTAVDAFPDLFLDAHQQGMGKKLGLTLEGADDELLVQDLLELMTTAESDFTLSFRRLAELANPDMDPQQSISEIFDFPDAFSPWLERWRQRLQSATQINQSAMLKANPVFIPRNHLVAEVIEAAISAADYAPFNRLVDVLTGSAVYYPQLSHFAAPPRPEQVVRQTFCGT